MLRVAVAWYCSRLYTSSFVDNVMCVHNQHAKVTQTECRLKVRHQMAAQIQYAVQLLCTVYLHSSAADKFIYHCEGWQVS